MAVILHFIQPNLSCTFSTKFGAIGDQLRHIGLLSATVGCVIMCRNANVQQEAPLSHRNRAAEWVSFGAATGGSPYAENLCLRGRPLPTSCARLDRPVNALQLSLCQFSHKET